MSQYLSEAFKKLNFLNEDTFAINDNGLEDFIKFEEEDEFENSIDVIDPEAETVEDLQDSYVGKVILDCCVCHSKIYKDVEDVVVEDDIANANEECPFCYTTDGYKVIGQVAAFGEEETTEEPKEDEDTKDTEETDTKDETELEEGFLGFKTKKEKEKEAKAKAEKEAQKQRDKELKDREERARQQSAADSWARNDKAKRDAQREYNSNRSSQSSRVSNTGKAGVYYSGGDYYSEDLKETLNEANDDGYVIGVVDSNGVLTSLGSKTLFKSEADAQEANRDFTATDHKAQIKIIPLEKAKTLAPKDKVVYSTKSGKVFMGNRIGESVNNVNVETDEDVINVATDDNGKVTVTTEPKVNAVESEEVITPIEPEVQSEINDNVEDGGEIEIDMDEFDEESFDELGENYLKEVYENVKSFKTSNVSLVKDKLVVEGVIKFTSGKSKKTNFIFESREATKSGKVRFIGENKEIARGRKSFTVTGRVDNKKFMSESLNYNYGVKGANGKTQRLYGTVKRGK